MSLAAPIQQQQAQPEAQQQNEAGQAHSASGPPHLHDEWRAAQVNMVCLHAAASTLLFVCQGGLCSLAST